MKILRFLFAFFLLALTVNVMSQRDDTGYSLKWEENFNGTELNTDVWNYETQVGVWNTEANKELQHYRQENVAVGPDGEGNNALIITAKKEIYNGYQFTSGRIQSRGKLGVQFGKIEARIKLPTLADGLWPAFWMLGTKNVWPASGEIDILEAGHAIGIAQGKQSSTLNGALHWQHEGSVASYATGYNQDGKDAPAGTNLYQYNTFTMYWTPGRIEMYLNDETSPYFAMDITGADAEEFRDFAHYFVLNLAVGGSFPGILNPADITAPLPAHMYVDYIKVYQKEGEGMVQVTPPAAPPTGESYGILSENPAIVDKLVFDDLATTLQIWDNSLVALEGVQPVYEGEEAFAFRAPAARTWFGFGANAANGLDLSHFENGYLHLALRTTATNNFWIGIGDQNGKEGKIEFNNGSDPYGFLRNGTWQRISIPVSALKAGGLDMSLLANVFMLGGTGAISHILVDDIYFSNSPTALAVTLNPGRDGDVILPTRPKIVANQYGIFTENPNITTKFLIDDLKGHIYSWDNTVGFNYSAPYDGEEVIALASQGSAGWWGFGIHDDEASDLSHFNDGYLHAMVKTTSDKSFKIVIKGANSTKAEFFFAVGSDPAGFARDGEWHRVSFPFPATMDLSIVAVPFSVSQGVNAPFVIEDLAFDDIYYSLSATALENPNLYVDGGGGPDLSRWSTWFGDGGAGSAAYGGEQEVAVTVSNAGWAEHSAQLFIDGLNLPDGDYVIRFKAKALAARNINVNVGKGLDVDPWFVEFMPQKNYALTTEWQSFTHYFTKSNASYNDGKLVFELGLVEGGGTLATTVFFNEVSLTSANSTGFATNEAASFRLSSNPVKDILEIEAEAGLYLSLYNISGQLVRSVLTTGAVTTVEVASLPRGLYILKGEAGVLKVSLR